MGSIVQHHTVEITRSPAEVWAVVSDYGNDTVWRKGVVEMTADTPGAPRVGTKVREVLKLGGRRYVTDTAVTETGDLRYRFAGAGDGGAVSGGRVVREGTSPGSATFVYDLEVEPTGVPRILRPVMARLLDRMVRRDLRTLREMLERG